MSIVSYNNGIPAALNSPSADQPRMLENTEAIDDILDVDHISFNTQNGGTHKFMHLPFFQSPVVINGGSTTEGSVIYSDAGTADPSHPQLFLLNSNATLPMSALRAFGSFVALPLASSGVFSFMNQFNIDTANVNKIVGVPTYTIPLVSNVTTGDNVVILVNANNNSVIYSFTNPNLTITVNIPAGQRIDFAVIQI